MTEGQGCLWDVVVVRAIFVTQECAVRVLLYSHCFPKDTV